MLEVPEEPKTYSYAQAIQGYSNSLVQSLQVFLETSDLDSKNDQRQRECDVQGVHWWNALCLGDKE